MIFARCVRLFVRSVTERESESLGQEDDGAFGD